MPDGRVARNLWLSLRTYQRTHRGPVDSVNDRGSLAAASCSSSRPRPGLPLLVFESDLLRAGSNACSAGSRSHKPTARIRSGIRPDWNQSLLTVLAMGFGKKCGSPSSPTHTNIGRNTSCDILKKQAKLSHLAGAV